MVAEETGQRPFIRSYWWAIIAVQVVLSGYAVVQVHLADAHHEQALIEAQVRDKLDSNLVSFVLPVRPTYVQMTAFAMNLPAAILAGGVSLVTGEAWMGSLAAEASFVLSSFALWFLIAIRAGHPDSREDVTHPLLRQALVTLRVLVGIVLALGVVVTLLGVLIHPVLSPEVLGEVGVLGWCLAGLAGLVRSRRQRSAESA